MPRAPTSLLYCVVYGIVFAL